MYTLKSMLGGAVMGLGALSLLSAGAVQAAAEQPATPKAQAGAKTRADKKASKRGSSRYGARYFPNYELTTQDGKKLKFFDDMIKDKIVAINFMFTSCRNVCPLETARIKAVYKLLADRAGKDVFFYSISIDPERDTPEALRAYRKKYGIDKLPGWTFLTGKKEEIDTIRRKLGLRIDDLKTSDDGQIDHNISFVLGNQRMGRWVKRSPYESSEILASMIGDWMDNWNSSRKVASRTYGQAREIGTYSDGAYIYRTRCQICHTIGEGDAIGPDLKGVTRRRDTKWLTRWLMMPDRMLKEKDPIAMAMYKAFGEIPMPNLGLSGEDVKAIMDFLESLEKPATKAPVAHNEKLENISDP